jgi:adenylate cyclase
MPETRKIAAILAADVVGYSRLAGADEDRTLARLRGLRSDLIDPATPRFIAVSSSPKLSTLTAALRRAQ